MQSPANSSDLIEPPQKVLPAGHMLVDAILPEIRWRSLQGIVLVVCFAATFVDGADRTALGLVGKNFMTDLHMSPTQLGIVFALDNFGAVIGALLCGRLCDRFGRRPVLTGAMAVISLTTVLTGHAPTFESLAFVRLIAGLALGGALPAALTLASEFVRPDRRGMVSAITFAGYSVGAACGGFFGAYLLDRFPWQSVFYAGAVLPLVVLLAVTFWTPETIQLLVRRGNTRSALKTAFRLRPDLKETLIALENDTPRRKAAEGLRSLFSGGLALQTALLWLMFILVWATIKFMVTWLAPMLGSHGISPSQAAIVQGSWNVGGVIGELLAAALIRSRGPTAVMAPFLIFGALAFVAIGYDPTSFYLALAMATAAGIGIGVGLSGTIAITAQIYPAAYRGTGMGGGLAAGRFGQVLSPLLFAWLIERGVGDQNIMYILGALPVAAALLVFPLKLAVRTQPAVQPQSRK